MNAVLVFALEVDHRWNEVPLKDVQANGGNEEEASDWIQAVHCQLIYIISHITQLQLSNRIDQCCDKVEKKTPIDAKGQLVSLFYTRVG